MTKGLNFALKIKGVLVVGRVTYAKSSDPATPPPKKKLKRALWWLPFGKSLGQLGLGGGKRQEGYGFQDNVLFSLLLSVPFSENLWGNNILGGGKLFRRVPPSPAPRPLSERARFVAVNYQLLSACGLSASSCLHAVWRFGSWLQEIV